MIDPELERAFDYRGDVTLTLRDGQVLVGYLSNLDLRAAEPWCDVFPADVEAPKKRIPLTDVQSVELSGRDPADGRSWEAWVARWEAEHGRKHP
ncbi:MAG: hypothetical protein KDB53_01430 [Planctomycetes bacterium]|nr:hypothetical protein [Planctomycetota bacterium]